MIIFILVVLLSILFFWLFPIVEVSGVSMNPTFKDGEHIVGTRLFRYKDLKVGDVVVYKTPDSGTVVIKRICEIHSPNNGELYFFCMGDNRDFSYDSRDYGYIISKSIICKVIRHRGFIHED